MIVYAGSALTLTAVPGGRANAKMVSKKLFEDMSLPHDDGHHYVSAVSKLLLFHIRYYACLYNAPRFASYFFFL